MNLIFNGEQINNYVDLIRSHHRRLCRWRDDGRVPSQLLLDDIRVYEFILNHADPEAMATKYFEEREQKSFMRPKTDTAKALGWDLGK